MNSRATQQFNVSPYIYAVTWLRPLPGSPAFLGAVYMSRASPVNRADSILSRPIYGGLNTKEN